MHTPSSSQLGTVNGILWRAITDDFSTMSGFNLRTELNTPNHDSPTADSDLPLYFPSDVKHPDLKSCLSELFQSLNPMLLYLESFKSQSDPSPTRIFRMALRITISYRLGSLRSTRKFACIADRLQRMFSCLRSWDIPPEPMILALFSDTFVTLVGVMAHSLSPSRSSLQMSFMALLGRLRPFSSCEDMNGSIIEALLWYLGELGAQLHCIRVASTKQQLPNRTNPSPPLWSRKIFEPSTVHLINEARGDANQLESDSFQKIMVVLITLLQSMLSALPLDECLEVFPAASLQHKILRLQQVSSCSTRKDVVTNALRYVTTYISVFHNVENIEVDSLFRALLQVSEILVLLAHNLEGYSTGPKFAASNGTSHRRWRSLFNSILSQQMGILRTLTAPFWATKYHKSPLKALWTRPDLEYSFFPQGTIKRWLSSGKRLLYMEADEELELQNIISSPLPIIGQQNSQSGLCLLSLDGGGVNVITELFILEEIFSRVAYDLGLPAESLQPASFFQMIGGTGTGGLLALFLGRLGMTIKEALSAYVSVFHAVYGSPNNPMDPKAKTQRLEEKIKKIIEHFEQNPEASMMEEPRDSRFRCLTFVCAIAVANAAYPWRFRTYPSRTFRSPNCPIWQAVRATMAVAGMFQEMIIQGESVPQVFYGGSLKCNNPTPILVEEAQAACPGRDISCLLSLGGGHPGAISLDASQLDKLALEICEDREATANEMQRLHRSDPEASRYYWRFNTPQGLQGLSPEAWEHHSDMKSHVGAYLQGEETSRQIDEVARKLEHAFYLKHPYFFTPF